MAELAELRAQLLVHQERERFFQQEKQRLQTEKETLDADLRAERTKHEKEVREERTKHEQWVDKQKKEWKEERTKLEEKLREERTKHEKEVREERTKHEQWVDKQKKEWKEERTKLEEKYHEALMAKTRAEADAHRARIAATLAQAHSTNQKSCYGSAGSTPGTTSSSHAVVYQRLPQKAKDERVQIKALLATQQLATPPADFFAAEKLALLQEATEATVQEVMGQELRPRELPGRWYVDTHTQEGVLLPYKPDAGVFSVRDVPVAGNVLFLLECKASKQTDSISDSSRGQAMSYGSMLLSQCRWRTLAFVVLVNGARLQVAKVEPGQPEPTVQFSSEMAFGRADDGTPSEGVRALWHLLHMSSLELGSCAAPLPASAVAAKYETLVVGGYSTVFVGTLTSPLQPWPTRFVAKVCGRLYPTDDGRVPDACFQPELSALQAFKQLRDTGDEEWKEHLQHVPKLLDAQELRNATRASVPEGRDPIGEEQQQQCTRGHTLTNGAAASVPPAGEERPSVEAPAPPKVLYMEYAGEPSQDFEAASFHGLVLALEVAHKKLGRVHRDVRLPNVTFVTGKACLIDWGMSEAISEEPRCFCNDFSPIYCPCSQGRPYEPRDDLCSLVLLYVYMVEHGHRGSGPGREASPEKRWRYWRLSGTAAGLYKKALVCDYAGLAAAWLSPADHPIAIAKSPPPSRGADARCE